MFQTFTSRYSLGATLLIALASLSAGPGCVAKPDASLQALAFSGEYGRAREHAAARLETADGKSANPADRQYILDRMRFALVAMSDGYATDDPVFTNIYDRLSQQGVNKGKEGESVILNEDLKQWKGEPFEQAIMLSYLSMHYAMQGSWDNARAAATSSQFRLKDFGDTKDGKRRTNEDLVRDAAAAGDDDEKFFNNYQARETNFSLGILLDALSNQQIGRTEEARSKFAAVVRLRPDLEPLIQELDRGDYRDLLVVSWGQGPEKIGTGPDNAIASWRDHAPSGDGNLLVSVGGAAPRAYPLVCDVNAMARDHMWNNLQDVRKAKSLIGSVMVGAGAGVTAYGLKNRDTGMALGGLAIALVGAGLKAGAHADTRYCDVMPQRFYVVPIKSPERTAVTVEIEGQPASRMTLAGIIPPKKDKPAMLRYVNLVTRAPAPPQWATSGQILYNNDRILTKMEKSWPYILGGDCVRKPTQSALDAYQKAGFLSQLSLGELQDLYRQEGLDVDGDAPLRSRHVLEGGTSLETPLPGTAGYARLFGQLHPPYVPKSAAVRQLADELRGPRGHVIVASVNDVGEY